jgi:hypothetical protein
MCHVLFVTVPILGKGLEFEFVSWKGAFSDIYCIVKE